MLVKTCQNCDFLGSRGSYWIYPGSSKGKSWENPGGVELQRLREGIPAMLHLFPVAWDVST